MNQCVEISIKSRPGTDGVFQLEVKSIFDQLIVALFKQLLVEPFPSTQSKLRCLIFLCTITSNSVRRI